MGLELVAIAEEDGWAFVRTAEGLYVFGPPYQAWNKKTADETILEQSIGRHGFQQAHATFPDWNRLIQHLKQKQLAVWQQRDESGISEQEIMEMVEELSEDRLMELLDHVEMEQLPNSQWTAAKKLLRTLLDVGAVRRSDSLYQKTLSLLDRCQEEKPTALPGTNAWPFKHTPQSYRNLANAWAQAGSAFS